MIARIWRGRTPADKANDYLEYVEKTGIDEYQSVEGHCGHYILRKVKDGVAELIVLSFWESMDAVRAFAGPEPEKAVYYPEDEDYLLELEDEVEHYDVVYQTKKA